MSPGVAWLGLGAGPHGVLLVYSRSLGAAAGSLGVLVLWWGTASFLPTLSPATIVVAVLCDNDVDPCPVSPPVTRRSLGFRRRLLLKSGRVSLIVGCGSGTSL